MPINKFEESIRESLLSIDKVIEIANEPVLINRVHIEEDR